MMEVRHIWYWITLAFLLSEYMVQQSDGSHFRGGLITWKPVIKNSSAASVEVEFSFRFGWRRSYSSATRCDKSVIQSGGFIGQSGSISCFQGCSFTVGSSGVRCTDFSTLDDWSLGESSLVSSFSATGPFYIGYSGNAWISNLRRGGGNWRLQTLVNLTIRADTGTINSSPLTATAPIITLQQGCNHTIRIPVTDEDGDNIRCRWAKGSQECGGICESFVGATLDKRECTLGFPSTGGGGWYAVALVIEDFPSRFSTQPLSSVPLQFLVNVFTSTAKCASNPEFVGTTRVDDSCIGVPFNSTYFEPIIAYSGGKNFSIAEIQTVSPQGFTKSDLAQWDVSSRTWYVNASFTPVKSVVGPEVFCYTAFSSTGSSSPQSCVTLLVGVAPPTITEGGTYPVGTIMPDHTNWRITYDKEFVRPTRRSFIRFRNSQGVDVLKIDASTSLAVSYPLVGNTLQFTTRFPFKEKGIYSILVDPGVVKGVTFCGAESEAVRDPGYWKVRIKDITPPNLTFTTASTVTLGVANISWVFDEPVKTQACTHQTPSSAFTVGDCAYSWSGINLEQGLHILYVEATDLEGNISPFSRHSWTVDLTPPTVYITSKPSAISNIQTFTFTFRCNERCSYECAVTRQSVLPTNYAPCNSGSFSTGSLLDGETYVFHVFATDIVGNRALAKKYSWQIDRTPPIIGQLLNKSVACGSNYEPSATGYPTTSDNRDSSPKLCYKDESSSGCSVRRRWTLTDEAGNIAEKLQYIVFISKRPPDIRFKPDTMVPCRSTSEISGDSPEFRQTIKVVHPCNRTVNVTFQDSDLVNRCGFTFSRTWTVVDDCGEKATATQRITVLPLQLPESPQNNELNVDLNKVLRWPQYPGAREYQVHVWNYGQSKPASPVANETYKRYIPSKPYEPGTRVLWQIQYVIGIGQLVPSPVWGFQTKSFSDLAVVEVTIPPYAFSGDTFDVSWRIQNKGNVSTGGTVWYDAAYISVFPSRVRASYAGRKLQRRFLDPQDWYSSTMTISLRENDLGTRYVFIETNIYRSVDELDRANNIGTSAGPLSVRLTPPPDLQVMEIVTPKSTFSGVTISVQWTVKNVGVGATRGDTWFDSGFWCTNTSLDDCYVKLVSVRRNDGLVPGASYNVSTSVSVPNAIYGIFFILVQTDRGNQIYEHTKEDNNVLAIKTAIQVTLTPPPDLVVSEIRLLGPQSYSTFEVIQFTYTVQNEGSTAPFEPYWFDEVVIISTRTKQEFGIGVFAVSLALKPGNSYSRSVSFAVPASFEPGTYTIRVRADYEGRVFEFGAEKNNVLSTNVSIIQLLPDLYVERLTVLQNQDGEQSRLFVNWSISNKGAGSTLNFQWTDLLYLESLDKRSRFILGEYANRLSVKASQNYSAHGMYTTLPNIFGKLNLVVLADASKQLDEENEANNKHTIAVDIPLTVADLSLTSLELLDKGEIYPSSMIKLQWTLTNVGRRSATKMWEDSLYLRSSPLFASRDVWLRSVRNPKVLKPAESYNVSATIKIPENIYPGKHYIEVRVNNPVHVYEAGKVSNNNAEITVLVRYPPAADLELTSVAFASYDSGNTDRFIAVRWSGRNKGNSMRSEKTWKDKVVMLFKDDDNSEREYSLGTFAVSVALSAGQEYSMYKVVPLPDFVKGEIRIQVVCDSDNSIGEIGGEANNVKLSEEKIDIGVPKRAKLVLEVMKDPQKKATYFSSFDVQVKVRNIGERMTSLTSWTDSIFLHDLNSDSVDNIVGRAVRLSLIHRNGALQVGGEYHLDTSVRVPVIYPKRYYLHVIVDVNNVLGEGKKISSTNHSLIVSVGPLPDLTVSPIGSDGRQQRGGSPYTVTFNITNKGLRETSEVWFDAVYLSEDASLDPFDWRLGAAKRPFNIKINESYTQTIDVFLPFDLTSKDYYFIFISDSKDDVLETNNDNNQASQLIKIVESPSTDIFIRDVQAPSMTTLNSEALLEWNVGNNGSLQVSGYRCDATYFSMDSKIDFDDYELGEPACKNFAISPSGNDRRNDISETKIVRVPLVEQGNFKTIVRTRSNTRDIHPENNIGVSGNNTFINVTTLSIDAVAFATTLKPLEEKIFRIRVGLSQQALVVSLKSDRSTDVNDLYLREKKPPSPSKFDARSAGELSADKRVTVPSTKALDYYLLVQNAGSLLQNSVASTIQLTVKYAKFEVTSVFPTRAAPSGNTTVRISGTLFPEDVEVFLYDKQQTNNVLNAIEVFRFSSTEIYATFKFEGLQSGTKFDLWLRDLYLGSNNASYTPPNAALQLFPGIPGKLSVRVESSLALRPGESGFVNVHVFNDGDTDASTQMMLFSITDANARLVSGSFKTGYDPAILFVPVSSCGPGGILPPKGYADVSFEIQPTKTTREAELQVLTLGTSETKEHIFAQEKELLKPFYYLEEQWEPVWNNFINLVGRTEKSLVEKLRAVSNHLSSVGRKIFSVNGLLQFLFDLADGTFLTGSEPLVVDDFDVSESLGGEYSPFLRRKYSFALGPRFSSGVLGQGWVLPWWDTSVKRITDSDVYLEWERQQYIFKVTSPGAYYNILLGEITVNQTSDSLVLVRDDVKLEYQYNTSSKLLASIKRTGDNVRVMISYDKVTNLPQRFTTSAGKSMTVRYDNAGKLKSTYTPLVDDAVSSNYEYEEQTSLLKSVTVNGQKTVYRYDENGFLSEIHYFDNRTLFNRYGRDKLLEKSSLFSSSGSLLQTLTYSGNQNGQIIVTEEPQGLVTTYKYDDRNRVAFIGRRSELPYKMRDEGLVRNVLHGDEVISKDILSEDASQLTRINSKGDPMKISYDDSGNIKEYDIGGGAIYKASFNDDGKLTVATFPDMSTEEFTYDENSTLSQLKTRSGHIKKYYFDNSGNMIRKEVDKNEETFSYSQEGNIVAATNEVGTVFIEYNSKGFPSHVQYPNRFSLRYTYDSKGRRASLSYNLQYNISYVYEGAFGKLKKIVQDDGKILLEVDYTRNGKVSRRTLGGGMYTRYEYDPLGINLLKLTNHFSNGSVSSWFEYSYDRRGRRIAMNTTDGVWRYGYDSLSQLTRVQDPWGNVTQYTYDDRQNRFKVAKNGKTSYYTSNNLDHYFSHGNKQFSYDKNGNLVRKYDSSSMTGEVFEFDANNRLVLMKQGHETCRYSYDALGNLFEKRCEDGTKTNFIVDPFGFWGADIVGKIVNGKEWIFVHGLEHGLVTQLQMDTKQALYYLFDPQGSVVSLMDSSEEPLNSYTYDTFGVLTRKNEVVDNNFLFTGQWGALSTSGKGNICYMRARVYDAEEGRFLSIDPIAFRGLSRNLYVYGNNNPVTFVDPKGTYVIVAVIGGLANTAIYYATEKFFGNEPTIEGAVGALVGGAVGGAGGLGVTTLIRSAGLKGAQAVIASLPQLSKVGGVAGLIGEAVKQAINRDWNAADLVKSFTTGLISGWIPIPGIGRGRLGEFIKSAAGSAVSSATGAAINGQIEKAKQRAKDLIEKLKKTAKKAWENFMRWLRSVDPNDIIGPAGFGDSRFVPANEKILYKIRFENAANATAPAQKVFITITLDSDFDMRTFRLGSYGFGNYSADSDEPKSFLQENVKLLEPHNIYLRIQAGLDIVKGEASWTFQTIDPETGFPPDDPRRGFLPPNNGTSGQGFVVFTINPKRNVKSFARLDAKAVIYFDKNEPIETPPIFNTIDADYPAVKISLLNETSETGTPFITFRKDDVGSGVRNVDLYIANVSSGREWIVLKEDIDEDTTFIPLQQGMSTEIFVVGEDNVGNRDESGANIQTIYIPEVIYSCSGFNNCSGFGNCTGLNLCQCVTGRYGSDCNDTKPPVEPPIIEFEPFYNASRRRTVPLSVSSRLVTPPSGTTLKITFSDILEGFTFNKGRVNDEGEAIFKSEDLANLTLVPPPGYSGSVNITVTALAIQGGRNASRSGVLHMYFDAPQWELPSLGTKDICVNVTEEEQKTPLTNMVKIQGYFDESLYKLHINHLPDIFEVIHEEKPANNSRPYDSINSNLKVPVEAIPFTNVIVPRVDDNFKKVNVSVDLIKLSGDSVVSSAGFLIEPCFTEKHEPGEEKSENYPVIVISIVAGIVLLILLVLLFVYVRRKCNGSPSVADSGGLSMEVLHHHKI